MLKRRISRYVINWVPGFSLGSHPFPCCPIILPLNSWLLHLFSATPALFRWASLDFRAYFSLPHFVYNLSHCIIEFELSLKQTCGTLERTTATLLEKQCKYELDTIGLEVHGKVKNRTILDYWLYRNCANSIGSGPHSHGSTSMAIPSSQSSSHLIRCFNTPVKGLFSRIPHQMWKADHALRPAHWTSGLL